MLNRRYNSSFFSKNSSLITCILLQVWTSLGLLLSPFEKIFIKPRLLLIQSSLKKKLCFEGINSNPRIICIFPGSGGEDELTDELFRSLNKTDSKNLIYMIDWKEYRGNVITAAFDSEAVGEAVADCLLANCNPSEIHSIGISVGSFAANSFAETCKKKLNLYARLTLLDPFCSRGLWGNGYGRKYFGNLVDYAEQYLNTDDPVPSTNDPLPFCAVLDVTQSCKRDTFVPPNGDSMHAWPVAYFSRYKCEEAFLNKKLYHNIDNAPERGTVEYCQ